MLLLALAGLSFFWWQEKTERQAEDLATQSLEHVEVDGADGTTQIHPLDEPEDQAVEAAQMETETVLPLPSEDTTALPEPGVAETPSENVPLQESLPPVAAAAAPVTVEASPAVSAEPAPTPVQAGAGEAVVSLTFIADCWTQLTDANGKVLFSALKRKGDSLQLTGKAPLELRLGYARGAQVSLNGSPVDVAPFISGETARLKLGGQ